MLKLLIFVPLLAYANGFIVCPHNACALVDCAVTDCGEGLTLQPNGGYCGCCPVCISSIAEGSSCLSTFLLGVPSTSQCEAGTHCDPSTARCVRPQVVVRASGMETCAEKKARIDARLLGAQQNGQPLLGLESPHCDGTGDYAPVQYAGSMAYCVFKNGTSIPGYSVPRWQANGMDCQCAMDLYAYMETGLIGKLFHCDNKGNYANMQCTGSVCFCVDTKGDQVGTSSVNIGEMDKLNC